MVIPYRKAEQLRREREEAILWRQGLYFQYAVASCFSDRNYPELPFPTTEVEAERRKKAERERSLIEQREAFRQWMISIDNQRDMGGESDNGG